MDFINSVLEYLPICSKEKEVGDIVKYIDYSARGAAETIINFIENMDIVCGALDD